MAFVEDGTCARNVHGMLGWRLISILGRGTEGFSTADLVFTALQGPGVCLRPQFLLRKTPAFAMRDTCLVWAGRSPLA